MTTEQRAFACLKGIAVGDAIGKQTENLSHEDVLRWYPQGISGFEGQPGTPIPRYRNNRRHAWRIGETTDDTERTIAVARTILQDGAVTHTGVGRELLKCQKCVHPGVRSLWEFHEAGDPARVTDQHDGCGAAIRVGPVGILHSSGRLEDIVAAAREASISTHGGVAAIAAAAAVAAAVSAAVDGMPSTEIFRFAQRAAALAEGERSAFVGMSFTRAVGAVHEELASWPSLDPEAVAARCFPNGPSTIVPLALALATIAESAEAAILLAANVGGDSDSVASIAGGILGARHPDSVPESWYEVIETVNSHALVGVANSLAALRR